ncbi:hypothetical protein AMECASPLE_033191 [Ameca splendens]|uniref:SET domain-containing protein n=1 Tax=Ameca splendens TaxID=208324 RepID=A0ABV0ZRP4_9TELE
MINHSSKDFNYKGMVFTLSGEALPVLLIKATQDIQVGQELLIDYGVTRKSFGGEAADSCGWTNEGSSPARQSNPLTYSSALCCCWFFTDICSSNCLVYF